MSAAHELAPQAASGLDSSLWMTPERLYSSDRSVLITAVREAMPVALDERLLDLDLAADALDRHDENRALELLMRPDNLDRLVVVVEETLGSGDLESTDVVGLSERAAALSALVHDLSRLTITLAEHAPELRNLAEDLRAARSLVELAQLIDSEPLLSRALDDQGGSRLMSRPETRPRGRTRSEVTYYPLDLAVVPPRTFAWRGAEHLEVCTRPATESRLDVELDVVGGSVGEPVLAFASDAYGRVLARADVLVDGNADRARIELDGGLSDVYAVGIARASQLSAAVRRAVRGIVVPERYVLQSWVDQRLDLASLMASGAHSRPLVTLRHPDDNLETALELALLAGNHSDARALRAQVREARERRTWDAPASRSGPSRPLLSEYIYSRNSRRAPGGY